MSSLRTVLCLAALLTVSCGAPDRGPSPASSSAGAVDLHLQALDGTSLSFASLRGKVVVVDVWATWCGPCITALPSLEKLAALQPDDIVVIGLSVDHDKKALVDFLAKRPLPYFVAHADAEATALFRTNALPTVFLIDREGRIRETLLGAHPDAVLFQTAKSYL